MKNLLVILSVGLAGVIPAFAQSTPTASPTLTAEVEVCATVVDHNPSGSAATFGANVGSVCCWNRISGATGETTIKHVWLYEGTTMAVVDLPVKGSPWRTHSEKKILPQWTGRWEVKVTDGAGNELKTIAFTIEAPPATGQ